MKPRDRRLVSDLRQMEELAGQGEVSFRCEGDPPEIYHLMLAAPGLARSAQGGLSIRRMHRCDLYLHLDYPRRPPVITWLTPVFHPNLLGPERNGGVCIGSWSASESLADLTRRLMSLVSYRTLNADDALDTEAAAWVKLHSVSPRHSVGALASLPLASAVAIERAGA